MITKNTPKEEVIRNGQCLSGRDCEPCKTGCRYGGGTLALENVAPLARFLGVSEEELRKGYLEEITRFGTTLFKTKARRHPGKPYGPCVFFDEKRGCTIHPVKPLECQVSIHNEDGEAHSLWFALNYFVRPDDQNSLREWQEYLNLGHPTIPGGTIEQLQKKQMNGGT